MKIELNDVGYSYQAGRQALHDVNLRFEGDQSVAIIGQNGAGKTTLAKQLNGILRPTQGSLQIDGIEISERTTAEWSKRVGYVFQNPDDQLFLETVREEFAFGPRNIGMDEATIERRIAEVAALTGLQDKLDVHPADLSPTEKKFCGIGAVVMMDPDAVVFDEPTCGQDYAGDARLHDLIGELKRQGKMCIAISHDMKFVVANFDRVIVMCQGEVLIDGTPEEVFSHADVLRRSYVTPPPITRVAQGAGLKETIFTVPRFVDALENACESGAKQPSQR
ncbi:ATP-binding cassette domain-containing protein [Bifidobacterium sp. ESL0790]|uniref:energy-coupling factor ABC transporter ATP-binding protein n=1 Tax=Bifidobacterium sp. ESL0790 TaxID=2983233 RepID=UPI0023F61F75|nr:ATP-binding cassette domain-containing protein [Bifidobacterium sp. ESL0790]WEV72783.1 ATP-binding cassette domain-containing protein [Bifidobacterium sp. ESL0790]